MIPRVWNMSLWSTEQPVAVFCGEVRRKHNIVGATGRADRKAQRKEASGLSAVVSLGAAEGGSYRREGKRIHSFIIEAVEKDPSYVKGGMGAVVCSEDFPLHRRRGGRGGRGRN